MALDLTKVGAPEQATPVNLLSMLSEFAARGNHLPSKTKKYDNTSGRNGPQAVNAPHGVTWDRSTQLNVGRADQLPGDWKGL